MRGRGHVFAGSCVSVLLLRTLGGRDRCPHREVHWIVAVVLFVSQCGPEGPAGGGDPAQRAERRPFPASDLVTRAPWLVPARDDRTGTPEPGPGFGEAARDQELVRCGQQGDLRAFDELMRRHAVRTYHAALAVLHGHHDAQDTAQDAFLAAWGRRLVRRVAIALNGASRDISDPAERSKIAADGWARWAPFSAAAIGAKLGSAGDVKTEGGTVPGDDTPEDVARIQRRLRMLQWATPVLTGVLVVLGAQQGEQQRPGQRIRGWRKNAG
jgi:hypothetical protein